MSLIIDNILKQAKSNLKTIVLAESSDQRILDAIKIIKQEKIANIILVGQNGDIDPEISPLTEKFAQILFNLRQHKGLTLDQAKKLVLNPLYFATLMVYDNQADGLVAGATLTTSETLKPALQIIKNKKQYSLISSFFIVDTHNPNLGQNGVFLFSDCGLNLNPNSEELASIAIQTSESFKQFTQKQPKIAMLSYSTNGSSHGESVEKVQKATEIVKQLCPDILIDGEIQGDAALVPQISQSKFKNSQINGQANVLIFPDLNSGNIAYKLVERIGLADAYGPITQGINKPVNDLSRGCSVQDIVTTVAITSIQANS